MAYESATRRRLVKALRLLFAIPVENSACPGTPDILLAGTGELIEVKHLEKWPPDGKVVRVPHFTNVQRRWLQKCHYAGGNAWFLLRVGKDEWLLFFGDDAAEYIGKATREVLCEWAYFRGTFKQLVEFFIS